MLEYLVVLLIGFWLGVAIFLYISCYWIEEILDLPQTPGGIPGPTASASSAHAQLKRLVARVVEEAAALPALARYATEPHSPVESTYEDLLATAILNKVIERYQNENGSGGRSSGIHSASASPSPSERSSPRSLNSRSRRDIRDITPPLHEEDEVIEWEDGGAEEPIELPRRVPFPEYGGDIIHPTENDFRDFDEVSGSDIQAVDGSWEENWLFQKKKINTIQSVPVPMLVPNSNTDYKALIGDRDADDTTDLSDNASEDEGDVEYKSDVKRVLDSKHIIGGQQKLEELDFEPDSLTIVNGNESEDMLDSIENIIEDDDNKNLNKKEIIHGNNDSHDSIMVIGVNSGPISKTEFNLKEEIHRTVENGDHDGIDDDTSEPYSIGADIKCSESSFTYTSTPSINTLSRHEREGEYEETVTVPVQRYADSLRRKHFDVETDSQVTQDGAEDLIPGSIAYRERKKWLNYVDMPNNPYSPEAIQKRLSAKSTSSLFDSMTSKNNTNEQNNSMTHEDDSKMEPDSLDILEDNKNELTKSATTDCVSDRRSESPSSPRVLKDVLSEEIPQYKRYGRDYYIKEAKSSSGGRKYNYSETSSVTSSVNKSTSLDNFDTEFASPVSASSSLSDLEATALHQNIVRAVLSPRNASPNFAINPIFENPDRLDNKDKTADAVERDEVRPRNTNTNGGDGYVENEDIVRLKIPLKPEITEDLFETYTKVRRSNTMRSEDYYVRAKRRPALNFALGGSLRLNKGFRTNLW